MLKVCIIVPKGLPVPNVKGGAIETLVTDIIKQNEKEKKLDITVFSMFDKNALLDSRKYTLTQFQYIKNNLKYKLKALIVRFKNLFNKNLNTYNEVILDKIKHSNFDYILVEDGAYSSFKSYLKYFKKNQMILHFHHSGNSDKDTDVTFSTFLGVSDFVTQKFEKSSSINDCQTLKNGISLDKFKKELSLKEKNKIRKNLRIQDDDFVVLYCGRLVEEKGVLELVKAIKNIENKQIKLVIVGSINFGNSASSLYFENLNNEILNSNGKIFTTGYIDNNEIYKYYKMADIAVFPTLADEAALLVNIEAMFCSVPTIITNSGGAPEYASKETIIISKENVISNIKDNILYLYKNNAKREKMIKAGLDVSKKYSTENFYNNLVRILDEKRK